MLRIRSPLDELAEHAALDKFHLVRAFRAEVGVPPYEYLTHLRLSRARELLRSGALVAEAAQAAGFCDESQLQRHLSVHRRRLARRLFKELRLERPYAPTSPKASERPRRTLAA